MGISIASGVPPALGLVTGIIGGIVVGCLAGQPLQVSGPAAGLAVLVWEIVREHGIEVLGPMLLLAGFLQFIAGRLHAGQYFRAMSPAVIYGMLAGIGVLIFASQFHVMLDDKPKASGILNLISIPQAIYAGIFPINGSSHELAALTGLVTIITLLLWNRFRPAKLSLIPGALIGVVAGTILAQALRMPIQFVPVPESLLDVISLPSWDGIAVLQNPAILATAFAMAFIASAETLLSAAAVDRMQQISRTNYDRELSAQGVGNLLCGLVGALPMTGVIVRSSTNVLAGAQTRLSTVLHGFWLLALVTALPALLRLIPTACLAAILVYTGYKLVDWKNVRHLAKYGRMPVVIYVATVIGIVTTDLLTGVLIGIGLTIVKLLYKLTHLEIRVHHEPAKRRVEVHLAGAATVLKIPRLAKVLDSVPPGSEIHMHFDHLVYVDHSCLDLLANWREEQESKGSRLFAEWEGLASRFDGLRRAQGRSKAA
jgi:MFS superfamily sulfate permease-like transporter